MCVLLREVVLPNIKRKIRLREDWYQQTEESIMFTYYYADEWKPRFFTIDRYEDAAEFLQDHGMITRYEVFGRGLKMYIRNAPETENFTEFDWVETELEWNDIKFLETDVIHIVASYEYELMGGGLHLRKYRPKAKCLALRLNNFLIAA